MRWKLYYGDGKTFSSDDGTAESAPALNVQAIVVRDPDYGRIVLSGLDYYLWKDDAWLAVDAFGLLDHLMDMGILKTGRSIDTPLFRQIITKATNDSDINAFKI